MAVYRVEKTTDYTVMSNTHLRDQRLSLKSKGLLSVFLSLPSDWSYSIEGMSRILPEGKDAIRSALRELEAAGYVQRDEQQRGADGRLTAGAYVIRELPEELPDCALTALDFPTRSALDFPTTENPTGINKDIPSKDIPPQAPQGGRRRRGEARKAPDWEPECFARFWALYPRGDDKQAAMGEWDRLKPDRKLMADMSAALKRQIASEEWQRGVGIPYACRWLKKRRWEDEVKAAPTAESQSEGVPQWT